MQTPEEQNRSDATQADPQSQPQDAQQPQQAAEPSQGAEGAEQTAGAEQVVESLRQELAAAQDRSLRLQAELENLRRRHARELQDLQKYAPLPLVKDLLSVRDNLERAIEAAEKLNEASALLEGVRLVATQLDNVFQQHGIQEIAAVGEPFNPERHEAISSQPSAEHPAGTITALAQTGFMLHDRVVRPALVMVSSGPPEES